MSNIKYVICRLKDAMSQSTCDIIEGVFFIPDSNIISYLQQTHCLIDIRHDENTPDEYNLKLDRHNLSLLLN